MPYKTGKSHRQDSCKCGKSKDARSSLCAACRYMEPIPVAPGEPLIITVESDVSQLREKAKQAGLQDRYKEALKLIAAQQEKLAVIEHLTSGRGQTLKIEPKQGSGTSEGTVVAVASDWHIEEVVGEEVGGLNIHTPEIAGQRATRFFQSLLRLVRLLQQDIKIDNLVLALLGDFISNEIHDAESAESNGLLPNHALLNAQEFIMAGIDFLLNHTKLSLKIPCHSGNHARTTKTTRFTTENGHSLEYLMYMNLAMHYRTEPRIQFVVPPGMHSYLDIYGTIIRFQHGHAIKYGGGVGGIYIPVNKAIAQWNKGRKADLDVFGHFHQLRDGGNFICNGSNIGYNGFALSIKADYEKPRQALFLMDKKRGRTCTWPILVEKV